MHLFLPVLSSDGNGKRCLPPECGRSPSLALTLPLTDLLVRKRRKNILQLGYTELASLMPAILNEYTRPDLFTLYGPSEVTVRADCGSSCRAAVVGASGLMSLFVAFLFVSCSLRAHLAFDVGGIVQRLLSRFGVVQAVPKWEVCFNA